MDLPSAFLFAIWILLSTERSIMACYPANFEDGGLIHIQSWLHLCVGCGWIMEAFGSGGVMVVVDLEHCLARGVTMRPIWWVVDFDCRF